MKMKKEIKKVSPFEYAIDQYINDHVSSANMKIVESKSKIEVYHERIANLKQQACRIRVNY